MCFCSFLAREETILALTLGLCSSTSPGKGWVQKPQSPNWRMRGSQDFNQQLNIGAMRKLLDHFRSTIKMTRSIYFEILIVNQSNHKNLIIQKGNLTFSFVITWVSVYWAFITKILCRNKNAKPKYFCFL